eukprot:40574_1
MESPEQQNCVTTPLQRLSTPPTLETSFISNPTPPSTPTNKETNTTTNDFESIPVICGRKRPLPSVEQPSIFEPYKIYNLQYENIYGQNEPFTWLCKCDKGPDGSMAVVCDYCTNKTKWCHTKCYGYPSDQDLENVKHKCYDCLIIPRRGAPRKRTNE